MDTESEEITGLSRSPHFLEFCSVQCKSIQSMPQYGLVQHHVKGKDLVCFFVYLFVCLLFFNLSCTFIFDSYTYMLFLN